jgi:hypothetical protein
VTAAALPTAAALLDPGDRSTESTAAASAAKPQGPAADPADLGANDFQLTATTVAPTTDVAPAATLLPAGAEQPGGSDGAAQGAPLSELFIDPTVIGPAPGALTAPAGEAAGGAALPAAGLHHLLLAGATVAGLAVRAVRQRIRRRRKAEGEEDRPTLPPRA